MGAATQEWANCSMLSSVRILRLFTVLALMLAAGAPTHAQRSAGKSTKIDVLQFPTVPAGQVSRIAFQLHADGAYFTLEDLRRYGGNMDLLKSSGERLSSMKFFTVGQEAEVVDVGPTMVVDVAIGPDREDAVVIASEPVKSGSEVLTYWADVSCHLPMRVRIGSPEGEVWDAFEVDAPMTIRYGNEKISTMESRPGGFTYSKGSLSFDSEQAVRDRLRTDEGQRFFRRKAVLTQLSRVINELETRIFFIEDKVEVTVFSAKGKHDYSELDAARDVAIESYDGGYFDGLSSPIDTWREWAGKVDFTDKKAKVTRSVALGMRLNLAQAHLFRNEFDACAESLSEARSLVLPGGEEAVMIEDLQSRLMKRRRALQANGSFELAVDIVQEKAPDIKNVIGKRSENKDVQLILPGDRFDEIGEDIARWERAFVDGSPEAAAAEAGEVSMEQRLGGRLQQTIGGMMLQLNPLMDADLVGGEFPAEILAIPNLVYLDISRMQFGALPDEIDRLATLQTLVAARNGLSSIPESIGNITGLKKLLLDDNSLTALPGSLSRCTELKTVALKGNPISPDAIEQLSNLLGEDVKIRYD